MSNRQKIEKLEKLIKPNKKEPVFIVVIYDDYGQVSEAKTQKAIAEYKETHPDYQDRDINVIYVGSEEAKRATEEIIEGIEPHVRGEGA